MKKVNKILMATVSVLLCLVLITTSVVSGVFARFVVKDTITTTVVFKKYGAAISVNLDALTKDSNKNPIPGVSVTEQNNGNSKTFTVSGLKIGPGDSVPNAMRFNLSVDVDGTGAKPAFATKMSLTIDLTYDSNTFRVVNNDTVDFATTIIPEGETRYFMPIGFTLTPNGGTSVSVYDPNMTGATSSIADTDVENSIALNIKNAITAPKNTKKNESNKVTIGNFTKDTQPKVTINGTSTSVFDFGYTWPTDLGADKDAISNYISNNMSDTATFTIKVTLALEMA